MFTATTVSARTVRIGEAAPPVPGPDQAVLEVQAVTLCGTDLHIWEYDYASQLPIIQGHEFSGRIAHLPAGLPPIDATGTPLETGDLVVASPMITCDACWACGHGRSNACKSMSVLGCYTDGALAQAIAVDLKRLYKVPTALDAVTAALAEPVSIAMQAVARGRPNPGENALVLGCGPIGLLATRILVDSGVQVVAVDTVPQRVERAALFGASAAMVLDPTKPFPDSDQQSLLDELTQDEGPSLVIEATGVPESLANALQVVCTAGRVVCVGISDRTLQLSMRTLPVKELDLLGSRNSNGLIGESLGFITRHSQLVASLITHRFSLPQIQDAFQTMADPTQNVGKIAVTVNVDS